MTSPVHSIRWRLQLWHGLILFAALSGVCVAVYYLNAYSEFRRIDRDLAEKERALIFSLSQPEPPTGDTHPLSPSEVTKLLKAGKISLPPATAALFEDEKRGYSYFSFHDEAGHVLLRSKNAPSNLLPLAVPARGVAEETRTIGTRRELCHSSDQGLRGIVGRDISPELDAMGRFGWSLALAGAGVWMLGLIVGWWLAGRALRPIQTISQTASRISEGSNAIQHHQGGGTVSVSTLSNNGHVLLVVQDDGPGIPPEDLPRIFDRFHRVDKARTNDKSMHTGLGLSIVKAIVSAEGGSVCCESIVGKGASFTVALPCQRTH